MLRGKVQPHDNDGDSIAYCMLVLVWSPTINVGPISLLRISLWTKKVACVCFCSAFASSTIHLCTMQLQTVIVVYILSSSQIGVSLLPSLLSTLSGFSEFFVCLFVC